MKYVIVITVYLKLIISITYKNSTLFYSSPQYFMFLMSWLTSFYFVYPLIIFAAIAIFNMSVLEPLYKSLVVNTPPCYSIGVPGICILTFISMFYIFMLLIRVLPVWLEELLSAFLLRQVQVMNFLSSRLSRNTFSVFHL